MAVERQRIPISTPRGAPVIKMSRFASIEEALGAKKSTLSDLRKRCAEHAPSLRELQAVLKSGSVEERIAFEKEFERPEFVAANQDFIITAVPRALEGSAGERRFYEEHRLLVSDKNQIGWYQQRWDKANQELRGQTEKRIGKDLTVPQQMSLAGFSTYGSLELIRKKLPHRGCQALFKDMERRGKEDLAAVLIEDVSASYNIPWGDSLKCCLWEGIRFSPWNIGRTDLFLDSLELVLRKDSNAKDEACGDEPLKILESKESYLAWKEAKERQERVETASRKTEPRPALASARSKESGRLQNNRAQSQEQELRRLRYSISAAIRINFPELQETRDYARSLAKLSGSSFAGFEKIAKELEAGVHPENLILALRATRTRSTVSRAPSSHTPVVGNEIPETEDQAETRSQSPTIEFSEKARDVLDRNGRWRMAVEHELERLVYTPELTRRRKILNTTDVWALKLHNPALRVYYYQPGQHVISVLHVGLITEQEHDVARLEYLREKAEAERKIRSMT